MDIQGIQRATGIVLRNCAAVRSICGKLRTLRFLSLHDRRRKSSEGNSAEASRLAKVKRRMREF
jgi:hypothetical protein